MKTVRVAKAQGMSSRPPVEDVTIEIRGEIQGEGPVTNRALFLRDAKTLRDALLALPGGTVDQLLVLLLQDRASQLIVPLPLAASPPRRVCRHSAQSWSWRGPRAMHCDDCSAMVEQGPDGLWYAGASVDADATQPPLCSKCNDTRYLPTGHVGDVYPCPACNENGPINMKREGF